MKWYKQGIIKRVCPQCLCEGVSRSMPRNDKSANVIAGDCHHSRMLTAVRVAGTGYHLTGPDVDITSTPLTRLKDHVIKLKLNSKDIGHITRKRKSCTTFIRQQRMNNEDTERECMRYGRKEGISNVHNRDYVIRKSRSLTKHYSHRLKYNL